MVVGRGPSSPAAHAAYKRFCRRQKPWRKAGSIPAAQIKSKGTPAGLPAGERPHHDGAHDIKNVQRNTTPSKKAGRWRPSRPIWQGLGPLPSIEALSGLAWRRGTFCSCKEKPKPRADALENRFFPTPFLLTAPKETVSDRQRKALSDPSVRPSMERRMKSGHSLPPAPLPLMRARAALPAALGRAPSSGPAGSRRVPWAWQFPTTAHGAASGNRE